MTSKESDAEALPGQKSSTGDSGSGGGAVKRKDAFVNPLEKIEQLLTCPICLDRYKQPKLLPCQHTFCLQCLDSYADTVHRHLKCPECRAEHAIDIYEGVRTFPTNITLSGFLDIHLEATEQTAAEFESYITRYNLERCKICDEKAEVKVCAHCDKKACAECRKTHMEMLKRDLARLLNQVKRLSNRVTEARASVDKNLEALTANAIATSAEIREYFQRYCDELRRREAHFLEQVDGFSDAERRVMSALSDVLHVESNNLRDACAWVDRILDGSARVEDEELSRVKAVFADGVEYLRNFQPDSDDIFGKKLRFSPGDDASKLPTAILNFGELMVALPQLANRYFPLEEQYLPKPFRMGLESEAYRRKIDEKEDSTLRVRYGGGGRSPDPVAVEDDARATRYRRRQQLEEEARTRLRVASGNADSSSAGSGSRCASPMINNNGGPSSTSPWSRPLTVQTESETTVAAAPVVAESVAATTPFSTTSPTPLSSASDGQSKIGVPITAKAARTLAAGGVSDAKKSQISSDGGGKPAQVTESRSPNVVDAPQKSPTATQPQQQKLCKTSAAVTSKSPTGGGGASSAKPTAPKKQPSAEKKLSTSSAASSGTAALRKVSSSPAPITFTNAPLKPSTAPTAAASTVNNSAVSKNVQAEGSLPLQQQQQCQSELHQQQDSHSSNNNNGFHQNLGNNNKAILPQQQQQQPANTHQKPPLPRQGSSQDDRSLNLKVERIRLAHEKHVRERQTSCKGTVRRQQSVDKNDEEEEDQEEEEEEEEENDEDELLSKRRAVRSRSRSKSILAIRATDALCTNETTCNNGGGDNYGKSQPGNKPGNRQKFRILYRSTSSHPVDCGERPPTHLNGGTHTPESAALEIESPAALPSPPIQQIFHPIPIAHYPGSVARSDNNLLSIVESKNAAESGALERCDSSSRHFSRSDSNPDFSASLVGLRHRDASPPKMETTAVVVSSWRLRNGIKAVDEEDDAHMTRKLTGAALVERYRRERAAAYATAVVTNGIGNDTAKLPPLRRRDSGSLDEEEKNGCRKSRVDSKRAVEQRLTNGQSTKTPPRRRSSIVPDRELPTSKQRSMRRGSGIRTRSSSTAEKEEAEENDPLPRIDYANKRKPRLVLGGRGSSPSEMNWPRGIGIMPGGEIAVCDSANHRVQIFSGSVGRLLHMFGDYGTADGQLDSCVGVAYNRLRRQLIVTDRYNHRVQIFDADGAFVRSFGGAGASSGRFNNPWGVAVDEIGMIYVVDKDNHRVQIFDQEGHFLNRFGAMGSGAAEFNHPLFIAVRLQHIYVTDSANHRVCVFRRDDCSPLRVIGVEGFRVGELKLPRGIAIDEQGFIVVADSGNNRIQVFSPRGRPVRTFGVWGSAPGQLKGVEGVALLGSTIVCSDRENHRVQLF